MSVAPQLAALLELKLRVNSVRWLDETESDAKQSHLLDIRGKLHIFENKPPPESEPCPPLKKGGGAYFQEDNMVYPSFTKKQAVYILGNLSSYT